MKKSVTGRVAVPALVLALAGCAGSGVHGRPAEGWREAVVVSLGSHGDLAAEADMDCSAGVVSDAPFVVARYHDAGVHSRSIGRLQRKSDPPLRVGQVVQVNIHDCSAPFVPMNAHPEHP